MAARIFMAFLVFLLAVSVQAQWSKKLQGVQSKITGSEKKELDEKTIIEGLKEALQVGAKKAVQKTSAQNGFFGNAEIKIPMPKELQKTESNLRKVGLSKKVDEFIESMNRAAEKAAPKAADIFMKAVKNMSLKDAKKILYDGKDDEATRYFEKNTRQELYRLFFPVVKESLDAVGATQLYKFLIEKHNSLPMVEKKQYDLDRYVTDKALDGLFLMLAREEREIRKNPAARVTDLLKKVFGK